MNGSKKIKKSKINNPTKKHVVSNSSNEINKPEWNNNINNLEKYKLSSADLLKRKINLISKNLMEAKKELHENYQESQIQMEKKKAKSPAKEAKNNYIKVKKQCNKNKSSSLARPVTSNNKSNSSCRIKNLNVQHKMTEVKNTSSLERDEVEIIEFKPVGNIISTQNKYNIMKQVENKNYSTNVLEIQKKVSKNRSFDSNYDENVSQDEENQDEDDENYQDNNNIDLKHEINDDIVNKFDNLNSIEESMKKLNEILEISSKNSLNNRYAYGVEKDLKQKDLSNQVNEEETKNVLNNKYSNTNFKEYINHDDDKIENNINLLEKELQMLRDKFKFKEDFYNNEIQQEVEIQHQNNYVNKSIKTNENTNHIMSNEFMEEAPMTLPKTILNTRVIPKPTKEIKPSNLIVFDNDNYKSSYSKPKVTLNDSKTVVVPKPKGFTNKPITEEPQTDDNIDYIKNLLLQTQNDIKNMNNQLSIYTNKIQSKKNTTNNLETNIISEEKLNTNKIKF